MESIVYRKLKCALCVLREKCLSSSSASYSTRACLAEHGQGTVEFALVFVAILAVIIGIAAIWRMTSGGTLMQHVVSAASHHVEGSIGAVADVFVY